MDRAEDVETDRATTVGTVRHADGSGVGAVGPRIVDLPEHLDDAAVGLWHAAGLTRPWNDPHADLGRARSSGSSTILAAMEADTLVGTVMVGYDGHRGYVHYLAVSQAARGSGIGRALMAAAESWAARRGAPKMQLNVRSENSGVVGFYESLGYEDQDCLTLGRFLR